MPVQLPQLKVPAPLVLQALRQSSQIKPRALQPAPSVQPLPAGFSRTRCSGAAAHAVPAVPALLCNLSKDVSKQ